MLAMYRFAAALPFTRRAGRFELARRLRRLTGAAFALRLRRLAELAERVPRAITSWDACDIWDCEPHPPGGIYIIGFVAIT